MIATVTTTATIAVATTSARAIHQYYLSSMTAATITTAIKTRVKQEMDN